MEQMESIRDQQESLAKLHFDLGAKQDLFAPLSEEGTYVHMIHNVLNLKFLRAIYRY